MTCHRQPRRDCRYAPSTRAGWSTTTGARQVITNLQSGTNIEEIAIGIYRINTPMHLPGDAGAFSFNQYLIGDDEPLLFHAGRLRESAAVLEPGAGGEPPFLRVVDVRGDSIRPS